MKGFHEDTAFRMIPRSAPSYFPVPSPCPLPPTNTLLSPSYLTIVEGERRGSQVATTKTAQETEDKSACTGEKREVGGLCWSTQHQAFSAPLGSWPCISPGIYCQSISSPLLLDRRLALCPSAQCCWAQPVRAGQAQHQEQEEL